MLAEALEAEVQAYIEAARGERDEQGHALVVRNGYAREREILCGSRISASSRLRGSTTVGWTKMADRQTFQKRDLAALHAPLAEGYGGFAPALPARALKRGLHPGLGGVLRHGGRSLGRDNHPTDRAVATRARAVHATEISPGGITSTCGWMASTPG